MRCKLTAETWLSLLVVTLLFLFFSCVLLPKAHANTPPGTLHTGPILEIKDEKLRIFQYYDNFVTCYVAIIEVSMIGAQASIACVRNINDQTYRRNYEIEIPLRPLDGPEQP